MTDLADLETTPVDTTDATRTWVIPDNARATWLYLASLARDTHTPCHRDPERWFSHRSDDIDTAKLACHGCPILAACREYADLADERHGVWGGVDRTRRRNRKAA